MNNIILFNKFFANIIIFSTEMYLACRGRSINEIIKWSLNCISVLGLAFIAELLNISENGL